MAKNGGSPQLLSYWTIEKASRILRSFDADEFTFLCDRSDVLDPAAFVYGDQIDVYDDISGTNKRIFSGKVRKIKTSGSAKSEYDEVTCFNLWWELDHLVYQQVRMIAATDLTLLQSYLGPQVVFGQQIDIPPNPIMVYPINLSTQMDGILNYSKTYIALSYSIDFVYGIIALTEANGITCAAAMRMGSQWVPDAYTYWDYTTSPPTLHANRTNAVTPHVLDLKAGSVVSSFELRTLTDMIPTGIIWLYTNTVINPDGKSYVFFSGDVAGAPFGIGVICQALGLPCSLNLGQMLGPTQYAGLAARYLASVQGLKYAGSLTLKEKDCTHQADNWVVLNFANGRTEWASAGAIVQQIVENLFTGDTVVTLGAPGVLSAEQFYQIGQMLANTNRLNSSAPGSGLDCGRANGVNGNSAGPPPSPDLIKQTFIQDGMTTNKVLQTEIKSVVIGQFGSATLTLCDTSTITVLTN